MLVTIALTATTCSDPLRDPPVSIPQSPSTSGGEDPFEVLPPPEECATGEGADTNYMEPANLFDADNTIEGTRGVGFEITNEKQQGFRVVVSGADDGSISAFTGRSRLCLEALPVPEVPSVPDPVRVDLAILEAASRELGASMSQMSAWRDQMGGSASLEQLVANQGGDPDRVRDDASDRVSIEVGAAVASGALSPTASPVNIAAMIDALMAAPGIAYLTDPVDQAVDQDVKAMFPTLPNATYSERIMTGQGDAVVVTVEVTQGVSVDQAPYQVVWFAIDPPIGSGQYHYYRAKCQTSAWASIDASAGVVFLSFWRVTPFVTIGYRTSSASDPPPSSLYSSTSPTVKTYDLYVQGKQNGSNYTIGGGWTIGSGGSCT